jgi:hypothetical protein
MQLAGNVESAIIFFARCTTGMGVRVRRSQGRSIVRNWNEFKFLFHNVVGYFAPIDQ